MKRWMDLANENPKLAEDGRSMIYQFKVGLGFLATIRKDGGPRAIRTGCNSAAQSDGAL